jgi:hypothetical protein
MCKLQCTIWQAHLYINLYRINCDCIKQLVTNNDCPSIQKLSLFTKLKEFKENILVFPSLAFYNYIYSCELEFRVNEKNFTNNSLNIEHFVNICVSKCKLNVPNCHSIIEKVTVFFLLNVDFIFY